MDRVSRPVVSLRGLVGMAPGVSLKVAQSLRARGLLRPDGCLRADDVLVARALAHLPGRLVDASLELSVARMVRRAAFRQELALPTVMVLSGLAVYSASLQVNADMVEHELATGSTVVVLPIGRWWHALRVELPDAAFDLPADPPPSGLEETPARAAQGASAMT